MPTGFEFLSNVTTIFTSLLSVVTSVVTAIVGAPLLLIPILMGLIVTGIGIFKKMRA